MLLLQLVHFTPRLFHPDEKQIARRKNNNEAHRQINSPSLLEKKSWVWPQLIFWPGGELVLSHIQSLLINKGRLNSIWKREHVIVLQCEDVIYLIYLCFYSYQKLQLSLLNTWAAAAASLCLIFFSILTKKTFRVQEHKRVHDCIVQAEAKQICCPQKFRIAISSAFVDHGDWKQLSYIISLKCHLMLKCFRCTNVLMGIYVLLLLLP